MIQGTPKFMENYRLYCGDCGEEAEGDGHIRLRNKSLGRYRCGRCATHLTQLARGVGKGLHTKLEQLSDQESTTFFKDIRNVQNGAEIVARFNNMIKSYEGREDFYAEGGSSSL